jgi:MIP family channel proteins
MSASSSENGDKPVKAPAAEAAPQRERRRDSNQYLKQMKFSDMSLSLKAFVAEIIAMALFVYTGTATATFFNANTALNNFNQGYMYTEEVKDPKYSAEGSRLSTVFYGDLLTLQQTTANFGVTVALSFGMAIAVLVYCIAHVSGGQLNPAVTAGLFLTGKLGSVQAIANMCAQLIGALLGSGLLYATTPGAPGPGNLGANAVSAGYTDGHAFLGEWMMTTVLVFTVLMVATDAKAVAKNVAPLAIGFAVFLGHAVLIPIDGCSINPARSFGPAAVAGHWRNFWVYIVGPFTGSLTAAVMHMILTVWQFDTNVFGKKDRVNDVSNDNNGLDDAALRI